MVGVVYQVRSESDAGRLVVASAVVGNGSGFAPAPSLESPKRPVALRGGVRRAPATGTPGVTSRPSS